MTSIFAPSRPPRQQGVSKLAVEDQLLVTLEYFLEEDIAAKFHIAETWEV